MSIAAVVNDEVISEYDLVSRMRMVEISSNLPDTPETRKRIEPQVLRSLVDEKLELQEAKKESVTATDAEINAALQMIEKQNNMKPGQLNAFLTAQHIDRGTLVDQLTASIEWGKLVRRLAAESTTISDEEIDDAMKRQQEHANEPESRVAEIFLAVDSPTQEGQVESLAQRLIDQMRKGARFSAIAQQFSQSATAAVGGDMGWLRSDQLPAELGKAVSSLRPGELSTPIRTSAGIYIMLVLDHRNGAASNTYQEMVYNIVQVVFPLNPKSSSAEKRAAFAEAESIRTAAKDCPDLLRMGKEKAPQLSSEGQLRGSEIAPQMRALIDRLQINQASPPIAQRNGVGVIMLCKKGDSKPVEANRQDVFEALARDRLEAIARRYLRDLRRKAYVDIRE
jgi:peptidyl-prolyl cis-trans isomerase SurA